VPWHTKVTGNTYCSSGCLVYGTAFAFTVAGIGTHTGTQCHIIIPVYYTVYLSVTLALLIAVS